MALFIKHYEKSHLSVLHAVAGPFFPVSHTRRYINRLDGPARIALPANADAPATMFQGKQEDVDYDYIANLDFEDEAHFQRFIGEVTKLENAKKVAADEAEFLESSRLIGMLQQEVKVSTR